MKKTIISIIALISLQFLLTACTTSSIMGLSRASYVEELEQKVENNSQEEKLLKDEISGLLATQSELTELNTKMEELQKMSEQIDLILTDMDKSAQETKELQELSNNLKTRMDSVHEDTLAVLVKALEMYMNAEGSSESISEPDMEKEVESDVPSEES